MMYFSVSEMSPLFLVHVTVGVGSPVTIALKTANFPLERKINYVSNVLQDCSHKII